MNEIVIAIIVTLVLLGLGIGLYFVLRHNNKPEEKITWSEDEKTNLKSWIKQQFSDAPTQPTDDELNCTVNKITKNIDFNEFNEFKNAKSQYLPNNQQVIDIMYIGKAMSECIVFYNWDKFSDDQLNELLATIIAGGDSGAKLGLDSRCFANKMKIKYTFGEFIYGFSLLGAFTMNQPPSVLLDFHNYVQSSADACGGNKPTPGGDYTNILANYLPSVGISSTFIQKILSKDPNCLVKSLIQLPKDNYFTLKNLLDKKEADGLPNSAEIAVILVYMKLLSNCLPFLKWQNLEPDDFIQGFPSVLQTKNMQYIALKFVNQAPYNNYSFLEFVLLNGLIEFYSGTVDSFEQMPNILQDFFNNILNPLIQDTSCDT